MSLRSSEDQLATTHISGVTGDPLRASSFPSFQARHTRASRPPEAQFARRVFVGPALFVGPKVGAAAGNLPAARPEWLTG
jgi:hypothetical protein